MNSCVLLTAARYLVIAEPIDKGIPLTTAVFLINDRNMIQEAVGGVLGHAMGGLEALFLVNNGIMFASQLDSDHADDPIATINSWLVELHAFQLALWLVKDNSVHCEMAYLHCGSDEQANVHSNFVGATYTNAHGVYANESFTVDELAQATRYYHELIEPLLIPEHANQHPSIPRAPAAHLTSRVINPKGASRLLRILYFVNCARATDELSTKISLYMSVFEILFSNDTTELSFKLSIRTALFAGSDEADRRAIFQTVKRAYGLRSRFLHGDVIPQSAIKDLATLVPAVDQLLRRVLQKIARSADLRARLEGNSDDREAFFEDLLFRSVSGT